MSIISGFNYTVRKKTFIQSNYDTLNEYADKLFDKKILFPESHINGIVQMVNL